MKKTIFKPVFVLIFFLSITACGNKGELYIPDKETKTVDVEKVSK